MDEKNGLDLVATAIDAEVNDTTEVMKMIGRHEAFGMVAGKTTQAWAMCLKRLKERKAHKMFGLTWEEFCPKHLNINRATADRIIADLNEFGATYFALSAVTRLNRDQYRMIAGQVTADGELDLGGELVPITRQYAERIRDYLENVEAQHQRDRDELSRTKATLTKTKEERDNAKKAAERNRDELESIKRKAESLFADATPLQKRLLMAQQRINDAVFEITAVTANELAEADQAMVDGLVEYAYTAIGKASGRDYSAFPMSLAEPRDLQAEYAAQQQPKKSPKKS